MDDNNKSKKKMANSKKTTVKTVKKTVLKKEKVLKVKKVDVKNVEVKPAKTGDKTISVKNSTLKVAIVGVDGKARGNMSLPTEIFGQKPNKTLIAQAVRIYLANQRQGNASTKTRSQVVGSTRKIYRQKGTGRARHGALKAPLFVGGGVAHGPHPHDFSLKFPKKMKKMALVSALSEKAQESAIRVVDGDFSGKTKEVSILLKSLEFNKKGKANKILFVVDEKGKALQGARNIGGLEVENATSLTTYNVTVSKNILFVKSAIDTLSKRFLK